MGTISKTITLVPSGDTGLTNLTTSSSYPVTRGYNDTSNSSFARFTLSTSSTGYIYYTFDTSAIPPGATITNVTAKARAYVGNTTRVTNTVCQLYSGTTSRGSNATFATTSSSNIVTLSTGTGWTRTLLNDLRIRIGATGSSSTSSKYVYFAGAEVVITYTVTAYDITASGDGIIDPTSVSVEEGCSAEIRISGVTNPTVKDNDIDVTSQLTTITEATETGIPNGNTSSGFTVSNITNAYDDADSDTYADLTLAGRTTGTLYLQIGDFNIPAGATIKSVSAKATLQFVPGNSSSGFTASCQMYANNTAKGTATSVVSSSTAVPKTTFTLTTGAWTVSELANVRFYLTATNNASSTQRHMYVFGVSFTVTYETDSIIYVYTLTNVLLNHVIVVTESDDGNPPVITVGTPSRHIIGVASGYDECVCTFTSDLALTQWEARATKAGVTPARGVGLLVESGGALAANTNATIYVENEELTNGDGDYTITVYGQSTDGKWSEYYPAAIIGQAIIGTSVVVKQYAGIGTAITGIDITC